MNPQQPDPGYQAPAPQQSQYDFIMNAQHPQPQGKFNLPTGNSKTQRILLVVGGLFLVTIVALVFMSIVTGGSNNNDKLLTIAQEQTELIRLTDQVDTERAVRSAATQNLATNINLALVTSKQEVVSLMSSKKAAKKLVATKNVTTDAKLTSASENNQYDSVFGEIITTQLTTYQTNLKELYTSSKSTKEKKILERAYNGANLLLGKTN